MPLLIVQLTHYLFDICLYLQSEKNEFDENQEENVSGDKESSGLKQRLVQKLNTEQGKCFYFCVPSMESEGKGCKFGYLIPS